MKNQFTKILKEKGWRLKDVAARWGIQPRQMSNVAKSPKQRDWDAVAGLPLKGQDND